MLEVLTLVLHRPIMLQIHKCEPGTIWTEKIMKMESVELIYTNMYYNSVSLNRSQFLAFDTHSIVILFKIHNVYR